MNLKLGKSKRSSDDIETGDGWESEETKPIEIVNWVNLVSYIVNTFFTFAVGTFSLLGKADNGTISRKYQTIVTPAGWAFSIWGVIFAFQALFIITQFLPRFRGKAMIISGVSYWYMLTCLFQVGWTFLFAYEIIWASLLLIVCVWATLAIILYRQYYTESDGTYYEFWLIRFPFAIHCGWLTAASLANANLVAVAYNASVPIQLAVGIVSLAILHAVSVFLLTVPLFPNYTVCCVLSWATGAISSELANTPESIKERFSEDSIVGVQLAAAAVSIIIAAQVLIRAIYALIVRCRS